MQTIFDIYAAEVNRAIDALVAAGTVPADANRKPVTLEPPRDPTHGDLSTNAAMVLAKPAKTNPRALAEALKQELAAAPHVEAVEIAGPGFLNLRLAEPAWIAELARIGEAGAHYGRSSFGEGVRANIEYVSANPTGPMHMGHCRGAVVGDALATLLEFTGHDVIREYYVNDAGGQVDVLARSAHLRYLEALGEDIGEIPEGLYPGDYLKPVGDALAREYGDELRNAPEADWLPTFRRKAVDAMLELIRTDLGKLGIHHDLFSSEYDLQRSGAVDRAEARLREMGHVYEGVLEPPKGELPDDWEPVELTLFRASEFGDDVDRPLKKSDGSWTYFGADAAYHLQKAEQADLLIDIWGADHAGTVKRIKAAVEALTGGKVPLDVLLVQMVRLFRAGEPVKMSKRSGNFVTLAEVVDEVGKDAVRFMMLSRRADAPLDFDFAKVKEQSKDNPVFYVQYAHARIQSMLRRAEAEGLAPAPPEDCAGHFDETDQALLQLAAQLPRIVRLAAEAHEPHRVAFFLESLAAAFHANYNRGNDDPALRVVRPEDAARSNARLALNRAVGQVIANGLGLMGVEPAHEM
ncbi:arginine--tRNA ligase [Pacificimonas flava]|uniref:Arginine--tRNA ligase n=2 Tax=Pacificimonas TaxID=1960290 RepID=A0A219B0J9_9SPHN|nr:arginine--tRNA ligase [Pacificimonas aurantium]MBZ6379684.1 arginine--tRNA ligase [Pacificimonas aurantium]OWV31855.1 arginine--tRNA ligase [Pacificimonas flava]